MKYPLPSLACLATNLRVAIEIKDIQYANELYAEFKRIVEHYLNSTHT